MLLVVAVAVAVAVAVVVGITRGTSDKRERDKRGNHTVQQAIRGHLTPSRVTSDIVRNKTWKRQA